MELKYCRLALLYVILVCFWLKHCLSKYFRIEELGKLNYALDVALQQEREGRRQMQANLRLGDNLSMPEHILHSEHSRQSATPSPQ